MATQQCTTSVQAELLTQMRLAQAAKRAAEDDGDAWLAELMAGRLEDLADLVRYHAMLTLIDDLDEQRQAPYCRHDESRP
jgi:hypothetical protein